jgi:hypothetical protein
MILSAHSSKCKANLCSLKQLQKQTQGRMVLYPDRLVSFPLSTPQASLVDIVLINSDSGSTNSFSRCPF